MKKNNKKGFTIVELVIVIAVIAILAGVLIPTFSNIVTKANDSAITQEVSAALKIILAEENGQMSSSANYYFIYQDKDTIRYFEYNKTTKKIDEIARSAFDGADEALFTADANDTVWAKTAQKVVDVDGEFATAAEGALAPNPDLTNVVVFKQVPGTN